jgi:hypothetical protein
MIEMQERLQSGNKGLGGQQKSKNPKALSMFELEMRWYSINKSTDQPINK